MKTILGLTLVIAGIALAIWLPLVVMLYGGIMQAVHCWGVDNSAVVWGIIRAVLCEVGVLPGYLVVIFGVKIIEAS